ncbi:hypothetical protein BV22DRAFT_1075235 [Leucogyrophana mollusca]|uniref:Uncharacterized protein n=1 Tax=Leucogyrophana mollusca TaxID=85980 RepID=A0ACB8B1L6_9AGAM|nr:hypothetical protein BV22DRAFT_1075235 [Leucogyrophana mollusca]
MADISPATTSHLSLLLATEFSSVAALTVLVWESLVTFDDEVNYIWSKPSGAYLKWLYLFARYFGLGVAIADHAIVSTFPPHLPVPYSMCRAFYTWQAIAVQLMMLTFDGVLLIRVHALYEQTLSITAIGIVAIGIEVLAMIVAAILTIPHVPYHVACLVVDTPTSVACFVVGAGISQSVLLGLTYHKRAIIDRGGNPRSNLLSVVIRDGAFAFGVVVALLLLTFVYLVADKDIANLTYYWFPVILSVATCRLIMNMQTIRVPEVELQFTSDIFGIGLGPDTLHLTPLSTSAPSRRRYPSQTTVSGSTG